MWGSQEVWRFIIMPRAWWLYYSMSMIRHTGSFFYEKSRCIVLPRVWKCYRSVSQDFQQWSIVRTCITINGDQHSATCLVTSILTFKYDYFSNCTFSVSMVFQTLDKYAPRFPVENLFEAFFQLYCMLYKVNKIFFQQAQEITEIVFKSLAEHHWLYHQRCVSSCSLEIVFEFSRDAMVLPKRVIQNEQFLSF